MADQTRKAASPETRRASPAMTASAARACCHTRSRPSAADARRRRGCLTKVRRKSNESGRRRNGFTRKMLGMQARPAVRVRQGPLLFPARFLLLVSGLSALALATFNLFHELHAAQVDRLYTIVALGVGVVWLASIILGFRGQ